MSTLRPIFFHDISDTESDRSGVITNNPNVNERNGKPNILLNGNMQTGINKYCENMEPNKSTVNNRTHPRFDKRIGNAEFSLMTDLPSLTTYVHYSELQPTCTGITSKELSNFQNSITEYGFLEPIISDKNGVITDGNKRYYAAVSMEMEYLPRIIFHDEYIPSHIKLCKLLSDPTVHFLDKAKYTGILTDVYMFTQEKTAELLGCSQSFIANRKRLLNFSPFHMELIRSSNLTERHARALLRIKDPELCTVAIRHISDSGLNVSCTDRYIDSLVTEESDSTSDHGFSDKHVGTICKELDRMSDSAAKLGICLKIYRTEDNSCVNYTIKIVK